MAQPTPPKTRAHESRVLSTKKRNSEGFPRQQCLYLLLGGVIRFLSLQKHIVSVYYGNEYTVVAICAKKRNLDQSKRSGF